MTENTLPLESGKRSLTRTILLRLFVVASLVFTCTGIFLLARIHSTLYRSLDQELQAHLWALVAISDLDESGHFELDYSDELMEGFRGANPRAYFVVFRFSDGATVDSSPLLRSVPMKRPESLHETEAEGSSFWNETVGGKQVRFAARLETVRTDSDEMEEENEDGTESMRAGAQHGPARDPVLADYVFVVGMDRFETENTLKTIALLSTLAFGAGLVMLLVSGGFVVTQGLRPLRLLEQEVRSISPVNLIPVTVPPVIELAGISRTLNGVISNLKDAFERERHFTANVAHELRTPVSEIRSIAEVSLKFGSQLNGDDRRNLEDILDSAKKMHRIIQDLLTLARCDAGGMHFQPTPFDFKPYVLSLWRPYAEQAAGRRIQVHHSVPEGLLLVSDKDLFQAILTNLFSNAVDYTPAGGLIRWQAGLENGRFFFSIANTVSDLCEEDLPHLREHFWKKDAVRSSDSEHNGLGLSLVCSLAEMLGFTVKMELRNPDLLEISLRVSSPSSPFLPNASSFGHVRCDTVDSGVQ